MRSRTTNRYRYGLETPLSDVTPLSDAISFNVLDAESARCAALLLDAGADPNFHNNEDLTLMDCDHSSPLSLALKTCMYNPSSDGSTEHLLERMIRESHVALTGFTIRGVEQSILLYAFIFLYASRQPVTLPVRIVKELLDMGCDINETAMNDPDIPDGWTCLFLQILRASRPWKSCEFEVTRFLIRQRANIFAKDGSGLTIFDHVDAKLTWTSSSYQRDLWYCALQREGVDIGAMIEEHPRIAKYDAYYTPEHFRALCHLDHWTKKNLSQQLHDSLEACPWSEEEISELSRIHDEKEAQVRGMEERLRRRRRARKRMAELALTAVEK